MRALLIGLSFMAAVLISAQPAKAGRNDDAWARCIWKNVPMSASNWLALPTPPRRIAPREAPPPAYALAFRLRAACYQEMTPSGRSGPPSFNAGAVRRSLSASRPAVIAADGVEPRAYRCTRFFLNDAEMTNPAGYDWGFGDDFDRPQFDRTTYFFAATGGGTVGLPETGGLRRCEYIEADGSFTDA